MLNKKPQKNTSAWFIVNSNLVNDAEINPEINDGIIQLHILNE
jgi:hypothetical protein